MHDNARCHSARSVSQYLNEVGIEVLPLLARSSDHKPIEHIRDNRRLWPRVAAPTTLEEHKTAAVEEWYNIPQSDIQDITDGLPNQLQEVIRAGGVNTHC